MKAVANTQNAPVKSWPMLVVGILSTAAVAFVVIMAVVLIMWQGADGGNPKAQPAAATPTESTEPLTVQQLLDQTNIERGKAGVKPLMLNDQLNQSAQAKADDMQENNYYEHVSPITGKHSWEWVDETGLLCKPGSPSENLNRGQLTAYSIISDPVFGFMGSQTHREAMLNPGVDLVGFGISGSLIVQHFCDLKE